MTKQSLLVPLCLLSFAACTDAGSGTPTPEQVPLKKGGVTFTLFMNYPANNTLTIDISKTGHNPGRNAAKLDDCVSISADTTIAANLVPGTLDSPGSFDNGDLGFETNCEDPMLEVPLDTSAQAIDVVINDGTAALHVVIEKDAFGGYKIDRCDADGCDWFR